MADSQPAITVLLRRGSQGDQSAISELMPYVYDELRSLAGHYLKSERSGHTLQATSLVHEAYLRLAGADVEWVNRVHFFSVAANAMRRILVDHVKTRNREKRGGGIAKITFDEAVEVSSDSNAPITEIDDALNDLAKFDERKSRIVEMVYFGGMTHDEVAGSLGLSVMTVHRELKFARAWIHQQLRGL